MNKKRLIIIICLFALIAFGYYKLFYKTFDNTTIPKNADVIITIDSKRVINTLIWNLITEPSQWNISNPFAKKETTDKVDIKDMIKLKDFFSAFHIKNQAINIWHIQLEVSDSIAFNKGILQMGFVKTAQNKYVNAENNISIITYGDKILLSISSNENEANEVADALFSKKEFFSESILKDIIDTKNHLSIYTTTNNFSIVAIFFANLDKHKIEVSGEVLPQKEFAFSEEKFNYNSNNLFTFSFTQPSKKVYDLMDDTTKSKISTALNFNIDSFFIPSNKYYSLQVKDIQPRIDSAITYTYDDDFNKVEKVVMNKVEEPSFLFKAVGDSVSIVFNYLQQSNKLEVTDAGNLFTPIPFAKSYCVVNKNSLAINSKFYSSNVGNDNVNAILFLNFSIEKLPLSAQKYLPDAVKKATENLSNIEIILKKNNYNLLFKTTISKKKNNLPIISL